MFKDSATVILPPRETCLRLAFNKNNLIDYRNRTETKQNQKCVKVGLSAQKSRYNVILKETFSRKKNAQCGDTLSVIRQHLQSIVIYYF
jgi:hypothetical protein